MGNPSPHSWQSCIEKARRLANAMAFEHAAECCLEYLHAHLQPAPITNVIGTEAGRLSVIYACAGNGERWGNFMGKPKHWIDLGEGVPLIQHTSTQFCYAVPSATHTALISPADQSIYACITNICIDSRNGPSHRFPGIEVLERATSENNSDQDVLWVYGDVHFSADAIQTITSTLQAQPTTPRFFGRKLQNKHYGNSGGEIFAVYAPRQFQERLLAYYRFVQRLTIGTPLQRCSNWEVLSLAAALSRANHDPLPKPELIDQDLGVTFNAIAQHFNERRFHPALWVEINDATEDFDYPFEYLERLIRRVAWVGQGIQQC